MPPAPSAFQDALQFPQTAFVDPVLKTGTPVTNALGLPQPITGSFAAVFPVDTSEGRYAVKCFLTHVPDQQARYQAISSHLREIDLPAMVTYEYQPKGIQVEGQHWPMLKMAWVQGRSLNGYVEEHLDHPDRLQALAGAWRQLLVSLSGAEIAHGDLQHGNVLVSENAGTLQLHLVDYDTMYVPALKGEHSPEIGHRNYQHPDRSPEDFGPALDHFSGLVIHLALQAVRLRPEFWNRFSTGENLLFQSGDFFNPDASALFEELKQLPELQPLVEALRTSCYLQPLRVPSLETVYSGAQLPRTRIRRNRRSPGAPKRRRPKGFERHAIMLLGLTVSTALLISAVWHPVWGLGFALAGTSGWLGLAMYRYHRTPGVERQRRLQGEREHLRRFVATLNQRLDDLRTERERFRDNREQLRTKRLLEVQDEVLRLHLKHHFIGELEDVEGVPHKAVVRLKTAGIRNAYHLSPDRLNTVTGLSGAVRTRISMWRAALVASVQSELPRELSPAQEQRFQRYMQRRLDEMEEAIHRLERKMAVQHEEIARVEERLNQAESLTFGDYFMEMTKLRRP